MNPLFVVCVAILVATTVLAARVIRNRRPR